MPLVSAKRRNDNGKSLLLATKARPCCQSVSAQVEALSHKSVLKLDTKIILIPVPKIILLDWHLDI